jgi:hypothetical protein
MDKAVGILKGNPHAYVLNKQQCRQFVEAVLWVNRGGAVANAARQVWEVE